MGWSVVVMAVAVGLAGCSATRRNAPEDPPQRPVSADGQDDPLALYLRQRREYILARKLPYRVATTARQHRKRRQQFRRIAYHCWRGRRKARVDLRAAELGHIGSEIPSGCYWDFVSLSTEQLGVGYRPRGHTTRRGHSAYAGCYNIVMDVAMEELYGANVIARLRAQACPSG